MNKFEYDVIAIGNALIDVEFSIKQSDIKEMGIDIGSMTLIDHEKKKSLMDNLAHKKLKESKKYISGGSAANTLYHLARSGLRCAFIGNICDDKEGKAYLKNLKKNKIDFLGNIFDSNKITETTGICTLLIDENKERTMLTYLGCAPFFDQEDISKTIPTCNLFYLEGYVIEKGKKWEFIQKIYQKMKENKSFFAISSSDANCVQSYPKEFKKMIKDCDICFANTDELKALSNQQRKANISVESLLPKFYIENKIFVMTDGENGSFIITDKEHIHIPAIKTKVVDLTGAGDAYAAQFISGIFQAKKSLKKNENQKPNWPTKKELFSIGHNASKLASKVIARYGPK